MNSNKIKKQWSLRDTNFDQSVVDFAMNKFGLSRVAASLVCDRAGCFGFYLLRHLRAGGSYAAEGYG